MTNDQIPMTWFGSLPLAGDGWGGGSISVMYRDKKQRDFARQLRNLPSDAEKRLWYFLRTDKLGVKFRRQAAIGDYVVDFVCFSHNLIVELDGLQHLEAQARDYDSRRCDWLESSGFRVMRFRNQLLDENIWHVVHEIQCALSTAAIALRQPPPQPSPRGGGSQNRKRSRSRRQ